MELDPDEALNEVTISEMVRDVTHAGADIFRQLAGEGYIAKRENRGA